MKRGGSSSEDNIFSEPTTSSQRGPLEQQRRPSESKSTRRPASDIPHGKERPASKRLKTSHSPGNLRRPADMSVRVGLASQPKIIDLTARPSNFQPHTGVKRLVIKNLRTTPQKDIEEYYKRTWRELDEALTAIFSSKRPVLPLEVLCRGVEATCRRGRAEALALHIRDRCKTYLEKEFLRSIEDSTGIASVDALRAVQKHWMVWNEQSTLLRSIFSYLDRSFLLNRRDLLRLEDLGIYQFRHAIFQKGKLASGHSLGSGVISGICDLITYDRAGEQDLFESELLKDSISMLHIFGIYGKSFEPKFLALSEEFFREFTREHTTSSMQAYIASVDSLLSKEALRCDKFNFDSTTKRNLLDNAHHILIEEQSGILSNTAGLAKLIESNDLHLLKALYTLLTLSEIQERLKAPWTNYIVEAGSAIASDIEKGDDMVVRMLELKRSLEIIIRDAFENDDMFTFSLREAFGTFMNRGVKVKADMSRVGQYVARYIDSLLRGGLKAVPRSLNFDRKDRDAADKRGEATAGDEDAELDRHLDQGLELFRFIEGKDIFEEFYKRDLAKRLLLGRSASHDAERNMISKLKSECGSQFTFNLEQMFKDQDTAKETMKGYRDTLRDARKATLDLHVEVITSSAWPSYKESAVKLPEEVAKNIERFERYYLSSHSGRKLTWNHGLAHSVIRAHFPKGTKELLMSGFQAIVLVLFNDLEPSGNLSYKDIAAATELPDDELKRTLQSLACGKVRVLNKHPKGKEINPTDTFTVNIAFSDPKIKIKINQIQLKETKKEVEETHEKVIENRSYETQAAIVRTMKSRKKMTHANLVAEVINQTKQRGVVEMGDIKKHIQILIEKEYLERDDEDENTYSYLA